jgi:hypothetical protein
VIDEFAANGARDLDAEARAEAAYLRDLTRYFEAEQHSILRSRTFVWRQRMLNLPVAGPVLRSIARKFWK